MPPGPRAAGDDWLRSGRTAVLRVPSAAVSTATYLLLDLRHARTADAAVPIQRPPVARSVQLTTPRLLLRPLRLADADTIQAPLPRREIVALMGASIPWPYPPDGALAFVRDAALPAMEAGRQWHWTIRPRVEPGRLVGVSSLMDGGGEHRGYWLDPAWQGQGFMAEACAATAGFWFETLGKPVLRESGRVSEKAGMRVVRREERPYVSGVLSAEVWQITADEWRAARRRLRCR